MEVRFVMWQSVFEAMEQAFREPADLVAIVLDAAKGPMAGAALPMVLIALARGEAGFRRMQREPAAIGDGFGYGPEGREVLGRIAPARRVGRRHLLRLISHGKADPMFAFLANDVAEEVLEQWDGLPFDPFLSSREEMA